MLELRAIEQRLRDAQDRDKPLRRMGHVPYDSNEASDTANTRVGLELLHASSAVPHPRERNHREEECSDDWPGQCSEGLPPRELRSWRYCNQCLPSIRARGTIRQDRSGRRKLKRDRQAQVKAFEVQEIGCELKKKRGLKVA